MSFESKYEDLSEDERMKAWHDKTYKKSTNLADNHTRQIGLFLERMDISIDDLFKLAREGELDQVFEKFVERMGSGIYLTERGEKLFARPSYISKYKDAINSLLKFHKMEKFRVKVEIDSESRNDKYFGERVPDRESGELADIIRHASSRGRVAISLMAFSGMRPESIGNDKGTDGIRIGDIEEFDIKKLEFTKKPAIIKVRYNISKNRNDYFTLIGQEGMKYIIEYLKERRDHGETLTENSQLVTFGFGTRRDKEYVRTLIVSRDIRDALRSAGFESRPYVLRRYFMTNLSIAEMRGWITHEWRLFLSGHSGDIQSTYVSEKGALNPELTEAIRNSYSKCLELLETNYRAQADQSTMIRKTILRAIYTDEDLKDTNISALSDDEFNEMIRKKFSANMINNGKSQKPIKAEELDEYLEQGWEYVNNLPDGRIMMKIPHH